MRAGASYIDDLASRGRYHFTTDEARAALGASLPAVRATLRRLKRRRAIADPYRSFHVIVPPEYRRLGCVPAEQFVPQLMEHLGEYSYVALLSAAESLGAAHHAPQVFQVMVAKNRRPIVCGEVRVQFVARQDLARTPTFKINTPRGYLRLSSPEATALELVGYADQCAGLDNVATVLADLVERIESSKLVEASRLCPIAWTQRLGYLLELLEHQPLASALVDEVQKRARVIAPLRRRKSITGAPRAERWKLAINAHVEPDV
jgi:predicted transcriptional regulator of viral defense system